jgi:hypothetical protein
LPELYDGKSQEFLHAGPVQLTIGSFQMCSLDFAIARAEAGREITTPWTDVIGENGRRLLLFDAPPAHESRRPYD